MWPLRAGFAPLLLCLAMLLTCLSAVGLASRSAHATTNDSPTPDCPVADIPPAAPAHSRIVPSVSTGPTEPIGPATAAPNHSAAAPHSLPPVGAFHAATALDANVSVDFTDLHQVIDGFGACQPQYYYANSSVDDHAFTQMGLSMLRLEVQFDFEPVNDNSDPAVVNLAGFDASTQSGLMGVAQAAQARGVTRFLACPWSPPAWMKTNNNVIGGSFSTGMEAEIGEYFSTYVDRMQSVYSVPVNYLSIQNEPDLTTGYWSCQYSPAELGAVVKAVGDRFALDGRSTQLVVADTSTLSAAPSYLAGLMSNPGAAPYVKIFSTHPYDQPWTNPDATIANWNALRTLAQSYSVKLWQTEYSNFNDYSATAGDWDSAMLMAEHMHFALTEGDVSAWLYWNLNRQNNLPTDGYGQSLYVDELPIAKAYAMGQFAKHVRPGAQRVGATSDNTNVLVSAYRDDTAGQVIFVCINRAVTNQNVGFTVTGLPIDVLSQGWRSSVSENHVAITGIDLSGGSATATLEAQSVTTFVCNMAVGKTLTLTGPNGGEHWPAGTAQTVTWTSTGVIPNVDLYVSYDGGADFIPLALGLANSGSYTWILPPEELANVKIRVQETGDATVNDTSNASFDIGLRSSNGTGCAIGRGEAHGSHDGSGYGSSALVLALLTAAWGVGRLGALRSGSGR